MAYPGYQNSLLLSQFYEFYGELARQKSVALTPAMSVAGHETTSRPDTGEQNQDSWQRLYSLLQTQSQRASRSGGAFGFEVYRDAQYAMAALADEIFLNEVWPGQQNWPLLETKLFQTFSAGETFFDKLDLLLRQRDPVYIDLAAVYFSALNLGFQGKYRGMDPTHSREALNEYRRKLFVMVFRRNPELLSGGRKVFAQSYAHTLKESNPVRLPRARNWWLLLAGVVLVWLGATHGMWRHLTNPVEEQLCNIDHKYCDGGGK
jgi:type VI secretion system protein ImpK